MGHLMSKFLFMTAIDLVGIAGYGKSVGGGASELWAYEKFAEAVAHVESGKDYAAVGDGGKARGAWQMHEAAWKDAQDYYAKSGTKIPSYRSWRKPEAQSYAFHGFVRSCRDRMIAAGVANPDVRQMYLCFAMGFQAFKEIGFDPAKAPAAKVDAANRVLSIFQK